jgi:endonuclease YncB( thermonuclease family)
MHRPRCPSKIDPSHYLRRGCGLAVAILLGSVALAPAAPREEQKIPPSPGCRLEAFGSGRVTAVLDGRTFVLADGREIRLYGIEVPPMPGPGRAAAPHPAAAAIPAPSADGGLAAAAALAALVSENEITLKHLRPASDRYGRLLAEAFVTREGAEIAVGRTLVAQGYARVAGRPGDAACTADLLATERAARAAKLGLWGDPRYVSKRAENPGEVLAERGRFTLVEGKVVSVRESGGTIYVNFGRRWQQDFTVTILKRNERLFTAAGLEPKKLAGRRVVVRGWIEERGGPWIEAAGPEQIEIVAER